MRVAVHLAQRPNIDARRAEIEPERGDTPMLRDGRVVAREQQPVTRVRASARPDLLTGDTPLLSVGGRARRQTREIGTGARLGEKLAPDLGAVGDRREPAFALLGV